MKQMTDINQSRETMRFRMQSPQGELLVDHPIRDPKQTLLGAFQQEQGRFPRFDGVLDFVGTDSLDLLEPRSELNDLPARDVTLEPSLTPAATPQATPP
jgi:hypothetical protein